MILNCAIIDEDPEALQLLEQYIEKTPTLHLIGAYKSAIDAVDGIHHNHLDILFLAIHMQQISGLEFAKVVPKNVKIVFTTAFKEYAIEAYKVNAFDYLLKPFTEERLHKALTRALAGKALREAGPHTLERLLVREGERMFFVPAAEIVRLSAEGNYVRVHTRMGSHELRETLARLEARLDARRFVRVHRSEILNLDFVGEIQRHFHGDLIAVLKNGDAVRVSRRYAARLLEPPGRR